MSKRGYCRICKRSIWWSEVRGWLHRKPGHAYQSGPGFSGGQHQAEPMEARGRGPIPTEAQ